MGRFWSQRQFDAIRRHIASGTAPWAAAHAALMTSAEAALAMDTVHLRQNGGSPWFRQDAVYIPGKDGVRNPESNRRSAELARQSGHACLMMAIAWRIGGEARYADKALELIHAWCINQDTRMFASGFVIDAATPGLGYGGDIVLMAAFPEMFLAIYLLADFDGWTLAARAAVKRWVRQMIDAQRPLMFYKGYAMYNNWEDHRLEYLATGALAIDDADLLLDVFARWREILPMKMTDEGMLPREAERTRSMQYHLFALNAMATVAEIGRQTGVELYDLTIDGRCMKKAVDYVAGHLLAMDGWPHEMIEPLETKPDLSVFELAYARWGDGRYLRVIDTWGGRPVGPVATLMTTRA